MPSSCGRTWFRSSAPMPILRRIRGSNSLILTDASANIRRIVTIVSKLDQHEATTSNIMIKPAEVRQRQQRG